MWKPSVCFIRSGMEEDASASGVADAFVHASHQIEQALLPWCNIVGSVLSPSKPSLPPININKSSSLSSLRLLRSSPSLSSAQRTVSLSNVLVSHSTPPPPPPSPSATFSMAGMTGMMPNSVGTGSTMSEDGHTIINPPRSFSHSRLKSMPSISLSRMDSMWRLGHSLSRNLDVTVYPPHPSSTS